GGQCCVSTPLFYVVGYCVLIASTAIPLATRPNGNADVDMEYPASSSTGPFKDTFQVISQDCGAQADKGLVVSQDFA
ncbi:hypothetical protein U1Q18_043435, partial [Sarracenia purpurea var. burkii]